jgi:hypothetical protein
LLPVIWEERRQRKAILNFELKDRKDSCQLAVCSLQGKKKNRRKAQGTGEKKFLITNS